MTTVRATADSPDAYEEHVPRSWPWWGPWLTGLIVAAVIVGVGSWLVYGRGVPPASMAMPQGAHVPPVVGYHDGAEIQFIHTEASDPKVAAMLTEMMDSPVIVVGALAEVPESARGTVWVFRNGTKPDGATGPFGFQPDVFDTVPGNPGYSPLRTVQLVSWTDTADARVLRSAQEIRRAEAAGQLRVEPTRIVVNMPITRWPGGRR